MDVTNSVDAGLDESRKEATADEQCLPDIEAAVVVEAANGQCAPEGLLSEGKSAQTVLEKLPPAKDPATKEEESVIPPKSMTAASGILAPLFLPMAQRKANMLKERTLNKVEESQGDLKVAGDLIAAKRTKRKRGRKVGEADVVVENPEVLPEEGLDRLKGMAAQTAVGKVIALQQGVESIVQSAIKTGPSTEGKVDQSVDETLQRPRSEAGKRVADGKEGQDGGTFRKTAVDVVATLADAPAEVSGRLEPRVEKVAVQTPPKRKRGRPRKDTLSVSPQKLSKRVVIRKGVGETGAPVHSPAIEAQAPAVADLAPTQDVPPHFPVAQTAEVTPDAGIKDAQNLSRPATDAGEQEDLMRGDVKEGMQQLATAQVVVAQLSSMQLEDRAQEWTGAQAAPASQTAMKVPDIFLTANERKRRLQEAKKEKQRIDEETEAAAERARLEKEAEAARIKEERKREAEEKKQRTREAKMKLAEEKKQRAQEEKAASAAQKRLNGKGDTTRMGAKGAERNGNGKEEATIGGARGAERNGNDNGKEEQTRAGRVAKGDGNGCDAGGEGTPTKRKRGRPKKVKAEGPGVGPKEEVVLLSESEKKSKGPEMNLMDVMRKRQEDFREAIRESQEAHAKLHAGKATHPFFKRKQGPPADDVTPAAAEPLLTKEPKPLLAPLDPLHVTQADDQAQPSPKWPNRQLRTFETGTSLESVETLPPVCLLEPAPPAAPLADPRGRGSGGSLGERQKAGLEALLDFIQAKRRNEDVGMLSTSTQALASEDALQRRFDQYKARSAEVRPVDEVGGPRRCGPEVGGEPGVNALWSVKYRPMTSQEVCGNQANVAVIRDWLTEWTARIAREQEKKLLTSQRPPKPKAAAKKALPPEESSEWMVSGGGSDSDLRDDEDGLANVLLLSGPTGVGKTATVYALAKELGFQILESNPSEKRSRATILQRFGEATESKGLLKGASTATAQPPPTAAGAALLSSLHNASPRLGAAQKRKALPVRATAGRAARTKRGAFAVGEGPGGSEGSAPMASESSGSFVVRGRAPKRRRKARSVDDRTEIEGGNGPVGCAQLSEKGGKEQGQSGGGAAKQAGKRRKRVSFGGLEKSADVRAVDRASEGGHVALDRTSEGGHVAMDRASEGGHVAPGTAAPEAHAAGSDAENGVRFEGPETTGRESEEHADAVARNGEQVSLSNGGKVGRDCLEQGEGLVDVNGCLVGVDPKTYAPNAEEVPTELEPRKGEPVQVAEADGVATGPDGTKGEAAPVAEANGVATGQGVSQGETVPVEGAPTGPGLRKRKAGSRKQGAEGTSPSKKRRSFGSPAVLSKVRTRPCSPRSKQGPGTANLKSPVLDEVTLSGDTPGRKKRSKRKSRVGEAADTGPGQRKEAGKGPVLAVVKAGTGAEKGPKKSPSSSKAVLLFEEVDQQFEEDKGLLAGIATLAASTKRPIILTCNDAKEVAAGCDVRKVSVNFAAPPAVELMVHACLVAAAEGTPVDPWVMKRLVNVTKGDIRKVLLQAQLWSQRPASTDVQIGLPPRLPPGLPAKPLVPQLDTSADILVEAAPSDGLRACGDTLAKEQRAGDTSAETQREGDTSAERRQEFSPPNTLVPGSGAENLSAERDTSARTPAHFGPVVISNLERDDKKMSEAMRLRSGWSSRHLAFLRPAQATRELQLEAAYRALPALADVALPCQLAAAVSAHQTLKHQRGTLVAERSAEAAAARVYGALDEEEVSAARVRKALQEAKAAAKATAKAELAERRRLSREANRAARQAAEIADGDGVNGNGKNADGVNGDADEILEDTSPLAVRQRRRGRRQTIEEDDDVATDVSEKVGDVIDQTGTRLETSAEAAAGDYIGANDVTKDVGRNPEVPGDLIIEACPVDQACSVCGATDGEESMLLCDRGECLGALHTNCADPPLAEIPDGDWFCAACSAGEEAGAGERDDDESRGGEKADVAGGNSGRGLDSVPSVAAGEVSGGTGTAENDLREISADQNAEGKEPVGYTGEDDEVDKEPVGVSGLQAVKKKQGEREEAREHLRSETARTEFSVEAPSPEQKSVEENLRVEAKEDLVAGPTAHVSDVREHPVQDVGKGVSVPQPVAGVGCGTEGRDSLSQVDVKIETVRPGDSLERSIAALPDSAFLGSALLRGRASESAASEELSENAVAVLPALLDGTELEPGLKLLETPEAPTPEPPNGSLDPEPTRPPVEEVGELRVEGMRALIGDASRQAVWICAAVSSLTDDLAASDLLGWLRGGDIGAFDAPYFEDDDVELGVASQAAACLAYASLRCKLDTGHSCHSEGVPANVAVRSTARLSGQRTEPRDSVETPKQTEGLDVDRVDRPVVPGSSSNLESSTVSFTEEGEKTDENRGSERAAEAIACGVSNGHRSVTNGVSDRGFGRDLGKTLYGPARLLAAAEDEEAVCGFLPWGGGNEREWLPLELFATTGEKYRERLSSARTFKEVAQEGTATRYSAGMGCRVAQIEYASFLGKMLTLDATRQREEEGLRRSERACRAHLSDLELSASLTDALMQNVRYGL